MPLSEDDFTRVIAEAITAHPDSPARALAAAQRAVSRHCVQSLSWPPECGGLPELAVEIAECMSDLTPFTNLPDHGVFRPHEHSQAAFLAFFTAATAQAKRLRASRQHLLRAEGVSEAMLERRLETFESVAETNERRIRGFAARGELEVGIRGMRNFRRFCASMLVTALGTERGAEFVVNMSAGNQALTRVMPLVDLPDDALMN